MSGDFYIWIRVKYRTLVTAIRALKDMAIFRHAEAHQDRKLSGQLREEAEENYKAAEELEKQKEEFLHSPSKVKEESKNESQSG